MESPRGAKTRKPKLIRYILKTKFYICNKSRYLDGKEKPKKKKADNKEKEKTRESEKRNYKKER